MIAYIILAFFCLICGYGLIKNNKKTGAYIILYMLIAPCVKFGSRNFDSTYFFVIVIMTILLYKTRGKVVILFEMKRYFMMVACWIVMFTIGWIINNRQSGFSFIMSIAGLIKTMILAYLLQESFMLTSNDKESDEVLGDGIWKVLIANGAAVMLQYVIPIPMYNLCYQLYYASDTSGYVSKSNMDAWGGGFYKGHYYRYFGLFETPMVFSCFCILVITIILVQFSTTKIYFKHPKIVLLIAVILGLSSQCKVFFFMAPFLFCAYAVYNIKRLSRAKLFAIMGIGMVAMMIVVFSEQLSNIPALHYLSYLSKPLDAFGTRFGNGSSEGYLMKTVEVSMEHFLIGVGPVSISGEALSDCAYVILLHHGGIISLIAAALYYGYIIKINNKTNRTLNMVILSILGMSISRTILISSPMVIISLVYLMYNGYLYKKK